MKAALMEWTRLKTSVHFVKRLYTEISKSRVKLAGVTGSAFCMKRQIPAATSWNLMTRITRANSATQGFYIKNRLERCCKAAHKNENILLYVMVHRYGSN